MNKILSFLTLLSCAGCTMPVNYSKVPMTEYDSNTDYSVVEIEGGYQTVVYYYKYQAFPDSTAFLMICERLVVAVAAEEGLKRGKEVEILKDTVKVSTGMNVFTGYTKCSGSVITRVVGE